MQQHARALDVPEEVKAQTHAVARALHDTGNVRHDKAEAVLLHDAQIGLKRREVVVGNLRLCRRDHRQNRGLAHVREANQPQIGDGLELQHQIQAPSPLAGLGIVRRLPRGRGEMLVAVAAVSAAKQHARLVRLRHVGKDSAGVRVTHHGSARHLDRDVLSARTGSA